MSRKNERWRFEEGIGKPGPGHRRLKKPGPRSQSQKETGCTPQVEHEKKTISMLLVPFSVGSVLMRDVQEAEEYFTEHLGGPRVRVLERGGDTLVNTLGRNDPWAAQIRCPDQDCVTCESTVWLVAQKKKARKTKTKLPEGLLTETSNLCR